MACTSNLQSGGLSFEFCSGHLLDLISVVPISNSLSATLSLVNSQFVASCQLGFFKFPVIVLFVSNYLGGVPVNSLDLIIILQG